MDHDAGTADVLAAGDDRRSERPKGRVLGGVALLAAGGVVGAALALGGGAAAQTPEPTQSTAPGQGQGEQRGPGPKIGKGRGHGARHLGGPGIHGEFVVPNADGGYQTIATQRGEVTAVSPTSITVRSEDGYSATYVVTADTLVNAARDGISTISNGDTVHVVAIVSGDTRTAVRISDGTLLKKGRDRLAPAPRPTATS